MQILLEHFADKNTIFHDHIVNYYQNGDGTTRTMIIVIIQPIRLNVSSIVVVMKTKSY